MEHLALGSRLFWIGPIIFSKLRIRKWSYFYYYQTIANAKHTIIAKMLFNVAYMMLLSMATWGLFSVFFGNPVYNTALFFIGLHTRRNRI
jgi:hypothetical protein